jgi:hypothetical protein
MRTFEGLLLNKLTIYEFMKDSPLFIYVIFHKPFFTWASEWAYSMNPILQLILNLIALGYAFNRFRAMYKADKQKSQKQRPADNI